MALIEQAVNHDTTHHLNGNSNDGKKKKSQRGRVDRFDHREAAERNDAVAGQDDDIIGWFDWVAENAALAQTQTLRRIIEINGGTEYLKKWLGGEDLVRLEDVGPGELESLYAKRVPLSSHADLEPYIQRIADGDASPVLTRDPITTLSLSSGTTDGRPKYIPFTRFSAQSTLQLSKVAAAHRARVFPVRTGGRILEFIYSSRQFQTKGGLTVGTATTHVYASEEFKVRQRSSGTFTCSPQEVISGDDYRQATYCHLLLGLLHRHQVEFVASTFAYSLVQAFSALEGLWEEICADIRGGTLSRSRVTSQEVRTAVLGVLSSPDPSLASGIEATCRELEAAGWAAVIPALWPNAKYLYSIMTGSMLPYLTKLRHYAGGLPLVAADYGSTESWIGVNLEPSNPPERVTFTVVPTFSYFEFIPLRRQGQMQQGWEGEEEGALSSAAADHDFAEDEPVPLSQVKAGQEYELVLTTFTGLYRYRLGDVVEVAGFYRGGCPRLDFVCRRKLILTVNIDKNTERDLQLAVERGSRLLASRLSGAELVDFTSHADVSRHPGHYVVYWEIRVGGVDEDAAAILRDCCREVDLSFADHGYVVSRRCGSIAPLELRVVEEGTFGKILDYYIENGAAMSQFKIPRCTRNQVLLKLLDRCTVQRFWSTAYD